MLLLNSVLKGLRALSVILTGAKAITTSQEGGGAVVGNRALEPVANKHDQAK